jgi:hypothetical protein
VELSYYSSRRSESLTVDGVLRPTGAVTAVAYEPGERGLATGYGNGTVVFGDPDANRESHLVHTSFQRQVSALVFSRGRLWAGGDDASLLRWRVGGSGEPEGAPIPEHAPILDMAATTDGRYLVAALADGTAAVHALPEGALVAHLVPFRDGSWATLHVDGRIEASSGDALSLVLEDPTSPLLEAADGEPLVTIGKVTSASLAEGPSLVRATVISPRGVPTVILDGRFRVEASPSATVASAYEVQLVLDDPRGGSHLLTASIPAGRTPAQQSFTTMPDLRSALVRPRALVIGNGAYSGTGVPRLPGAIVDADAIAAAITGPGSWRVPPDRITRVKDATGKAMISRIESFFRSAEPGETLLFYFAGHGLSSGGDGYLLPIDYAPGSAAMPDFGETALSATRLWKAIGASKAAGTVVILDACRAGSFVLPAESVSARAEQRPVAFLTSTSAGTAALDTHHGGPFTQALVHALHDVDAVNPETRTVTVQTAFQLALRAAAPQHPRLFGSLDDLPLAWPDARKEPSVVVAATDTLSATLRTSREVRHMPEGDRFNAASHLLTIRLRFGHDADALRVRTFRPYADHDAPAKSFYVHMGGARAGGHLDVEVPLDDLEPGHYRVEVEPCLASSCEFPIEFPVDLPP